MWVLPSPPARTCCNREGRDEERKSHHCVRHSRGLQRFPCAKTALLLLGNELADVNLRVTLVGAKSKGATEVAPLRKLLLSYSVQRLKTSEPFVPPKPNELLSA